MRSDPANFSEAGKLVWMALTSKQREVVRADYPIKAARNSLICELRGDQVDVTVLAEISGMSRQSVSRILNRELAPDKASLQALKSELKKIQKAVGRLGAHVARLEQQAGG